VVTQWRSIRFVFCILGVCLLFKSGQAVHSAWSGQRERQMQWEADEELVVVRAAREADSAPRPFRISFPRLGIARFVMKGESKELLKKGPVWLPSTAAPGEPGNSVIAAHRDTHFRFLKRVKSGDLIRILRSGKTYEYRVTSISVVDKTNTALLAPTESPALTLVTCFPFRYVGPAPRRYIVRATGVQKPSELTQRKNVREVLP
jgi:LPXTG-site transpeptidase (sortase) family protein